MSIVATIEKAKQVYAKAGLVCGQQLLPPADESSIDAITTALSLTVPPELRAVFRVHGGQEDISPGITGLFGQHRLHTPSEVVENHRMFSDHCLLDPLPPFPPRVGDQGYWVPQLIPFASWDSYNLCIDTVSGEVWEFNPNQGLIRHRPTIEAVLEEILSTICAGGSPELGWNNEIGCKVS